MNFLHFSFEPISDLLLYDLFMVTIAVLKRHDHDEKQLGEESVYLLTFPHCSSSLEEVRTGSQAGLDPRVTAQAEAVEICCSLVCSSRLTEPAFL